MTCNILSKLSCNLSESAFILVVITVSLIILLSADTLLDFKLAVTQQHISPGVSHDGSCFLGRIHSDVSSNIPKKVYHIVTDNFVNLLHISYA